MKTYSRAGAESDYPCLAFDLKKTENTMVLGEGSASVCLELGKMTTLWLMLPEWVMRLKN